jgi:hypothetical protein
MNLSEAQPLRNVQVVRLKGTALNSAKNKVSHSSSSNPKDWKTHKLDCAKLGLLSLEPKFDPTLLHKFQRWDDDHIDQNTNLVLSVIHPVTEKRLKSLVAVIKIKEQHRGFRVLSVEASVIEKLPAKQMKTVKDLMADRTQEGHLLVIFGMGVGAY